MNNPVFEHISVFASSEPKIQMRAMVRFILENSISEFERTKLAWRISKYSRKTGISYNEAVEEIRKEVRKIIEVRLESF